MKLMQHTLIFRTRLLGWAIAMTVAPAMLSAFSDTERQALRALMDDVQASLAEAGLPPEANISVLPLGGDQSAYVEGLLKSTVTRTGLTYVEGGQSPFWSALLEEMEWNERKADLLDPETLTAFGRLQATQYLLYGLVREVSSSGAGTFAELELHLASIETKKHLWGDIFAERLYQGDATRGIIRLNPEVRKVMRFAFDNTALTSSGVPAETTVAMTTLAGDLDGYATSLTEEMLTGAGLRPVRLPGRTPAETMAAVRGSPQTAKAVLIGAVRDLSRTLEETNLLSEVFEINTEIQLRIQDATTGAVLWSKSLSATGTETESISAFEAIQRYKLPLGIGLAVLIGLLILGKLFGAMTRPR